MKRLLLAVVGTAVVLALIYTGLRVFVYDLWRFRGEDLDMWPNLGPGAVVVVDKRATPTRGDLVVVTRKADGKAMVRRVVALPGDTVGVVDLRPFVDGVRSSWSDVGQVYERGKPRLVHRERLGEASYLVLDDPRRGGAPRYATRVDGYFVLADRREDAEHGDSRSFGAVAPAEVRGVVRWIVDAGRLPYVGDYSPPNRSGAE